MSYDGVVTGAMVHELAGKLTMGKIEKIYQPQPDQLLFSIHTKEGRQKLFISSSGAHSAAYLVDDSPKNPEKPPVFCMVLRKHLGAARITAVKQRENDRIIEILMETVNELGFSINRKLIVEIMGKHSNVLLLDTQTGKIIDSIKHISIDVNRARQILPGKVYEYPPSQHKIPFSLINEGEMTDLVKGQLQPERSILGGIQGLSPALAQTVAAESVDDIDGSVSPTRACAFLGRLSDSIKLGNFKPIVYVDSEGKPADFHITPLTAFEEDSRYSSVSFETLSEAACYYFRNREASNTVKQRSNDLMRLLKSQLDKQKLKLQRLGEDLYNAENSDKYRLYGELLTANIHMARPGMKELLVKSYYDGAEIVIPLDPRFSPARNAQNYYKKYGKAKTAIKEKKVQLEETHSEISYLESVATFIEQAQTMEEIDLLRQELIESGYSRYRRAPKNNRQKKYRPEPHRYTLSSGKTVMAGRNNRENDWLTFKKASSSDLWFHTKDIPGSHVILFNEGADATETELFETAAIAALHSKGSSSENVPVDYTRIRYVKKPSGSKPGFVIFTHNRTIYVNPASKEKLNLEKTPKGAASD